MPLVALSSTLSRQAAPAPRASPRGDAEARSERAHRRARACTQGQRPRHDHARAQQGEGPDHRRELPAVRARRPLRRHGLPPGDAELHDPGRRLRRPSSPRSRPGRRSGTRPGTASATRAGRWRWRAPTTPNSATCQFFINVTRQPPAGLRHRRRRLRRLRRGGRGDATRGQGLADADDDSRRVTNAPADLGRDPQRARAQDLDAARAHADAEPPSRPAQTVAESRRLSGLASPRPDRRAPSGA